MKTIIYVDGFNLFYGCLKHSQDKWLDLKKLLFDQIVLIQNPKSELIKIKFFTADIRSKLASRGDIAHKAQMTYHRALEKTYPDKIEIIKGNFILEKANLFAYKKPIDKANRVFVWKLEEKQTDVNLAIESYRDIVDGKAEQLIFVSNDSDIAPALKAISEDFNQKCTIGVILPLRKSPGKKISRPNNKQLSEYSSWTRKYITDEEFSKSHLPGKIPTLKKPIIKPDYW